MHSSIALLLSALCAGSLFLAAFLLLTGVVQANRVANNWLGSFFLLLSLVFIELLVEQTGNPSSILIRITEWPRWAIFPCLYIAVFAFVHPQKQPPLFLLHFLPAAVFVALTFVGGRVLPGWMAFAARYFFFVQGLVYGVLNLRILIAHKTRIRQLLADNASDLNWLRSFVYAPLMVAAVWFGFRLLPAMDGVLYLLCLCLSLYFISAAFRQRAVYPQEIATVVDEPKVSTLSQRLTPQQIDLLKERVALVIEQKKPYLDASLNLQTLADQAGINTHELSLVLNQGFGMNFYAFINRLRGEEAIKLLSSGEYGRGDMEAVAFRAGFNSRTTFYAAIKNLTGETPINLLKQGIPANNKKSH